MIRLFVISTTLKAKIREKKLHFHVIFHISLQVATCEMDVHGQMLSYQILSGTIHLDYSSLYFIKIFSIHDTVRIEIIHILSGKPGFERAGFIKTKSNKVQI